MEKLNKPSLPTAILIASIILGGFYYMSQQNKLDGEKQIQTERTVKEEAVRTSSKLSLITCITDAEKEAQRLNTELVNWAKTPEAKSYNLSGSFDSIKVLLEKDKSECFKKYPQN